jgi:hypothetical protein
MTLSQAEKVTSMGDLNPDSGPLPVSADTTRESGIPPARERWSEVRTLAARAEEHAELALAENIHVEANLGLLLRGLSSLAAGAEAMRRSNSNLSEELDSLRELLARCHADEMALKHRVISLEQTVDATKRDASRARAFFIEQEDAFLRELITDHEHELRELRRELSEAIAARDDARRRSEPAPADKPSAEIGALRLRQIRMPEGVRRDTPAPARLDTPAAVRRDTPTAVRRDTPTALPSVPPRPSSRPPLRPKPDLSMRPLVDYSLTTKDAGGERVGTEIDDTPFDGI